MSAFISIRWRRLFYLIFYLQQGFSSYKFTSKQREAVNWQLLFLLHCIDIYENDCLLYCMILSRRTYLHKCKTKQEIKTYYLNNLVRSIQLYTHIFPLYRIRDRYSCSRSRCRVPLNPAQIKIKIKRTTFFKEVFI